LPKPACVASIARAIVRRCAFGIPRTCSRNVFRSSICKIGLEIAAVLFDCALFALLRDLPVHPLHKPVEILLGNCVLTKRIIIGMNRNRSERDNVIPMKNSNVLSVGSPLEKGREIAARLGGRKRRHSASILRRYSEQLKCLPPSVISLLDRPPERITTDYAAAFAEVRLAVDFRRTNSVEVASVGLFWVGAF